MGFVFANFIDQRIESAQRTNVTHPTRDARVGTAVIAHRFIGGIRSRHESAVRETDG